MNNSYNFHDIYAGDEKLSINLNLNFQSYSINEQSTEWQTDTQQSQFVTWINIYYDKNKTITKWWLLWLLAVTGMY